MGAVIARGQAERSKVAYASSLRLPAMLLARIATDIASQAGRESLPTGIKPVDLREMRAID